MRLGGIDLQQDHLLIELYHLAPADPSVTISHLNDLRWVL